MTPPLARPWTLLALGGVACLLLAITWPRLTISYDLGYFLPTPQSSAQALLIERLGQGPGTQLIFAVLPDATSSAATQVADALRDIADVERVLPEDSAPSIASIPAAIWRHRALLTDVPVSVEQWEAALDERLMDSMLADDELLELIAADPLLASVTALERASAAAQSPQFSSANDRYLLLQTSSGAFDLSTQTDTVTSIRRTLSEFGFAQARLYGSGVYGVDLQASVRQESILFSVLASIALAALMFWRFRSLRLVLAVGVPLIVGGLAGLCATALCFDQVHGITLAFGFTLLGVAIDYPLHLFSHAESTRTNATRIWPTLLLGVTSTLIAYLAFVFGGTTGIQQLGLFAAVGIAVAATATWLLTAKVLPSPRQAQTGENTQADAQYPALRHLPWLVCVIGSAVLLYNQSLFSNDLSRMTPVPTATLIEDAALRSRMGVADMRHIVSVRDATLQGTLANVEVLTEQLEVAVTSGQLGGYQSISCLLPSAARQAERQARMLMTLDNGSFDRALTDSNFAPAAFAEFRSYLSASADSATRLTPQMLLEQSPELQPLVTSMLYRANNQWVALVFLQGLATDPAALKSSITAIETAELVDLKAASLTLVADYRERVFELLGAALVAISLLLLISTRNPLRVVWLLGTLAAALGTSLTAGHFLLGGLSLFDVIALALVAGLGLDYGLFFSKATSSTADQQQTTRAISLCALSSLLVFGILSLSGVPLLRGLGITVASGVAAAYVLARLGRHGGFRFLN